jgi:hypothetical protein
MGSLVNHVNRRRSPQSRKLPETAYDTKRGPSEDLTVERLSSVQVFKRAIKEIDDRIAYVPRPQLEKVIHAFLDLLNSNVIETAFDQSPINKARVKGIERSEAIRNYGGVKPLTAEQVVDVLNVSRQSVNTWRNEKKIIGLTQAKRGFIYPAWQFDLQRRQVVDGLEDVISELDTTDMWSAAIFFTSPNIVLDDRVPIDVLRDEKDEQSRKLVLRAAALWRRQGAS